MGADLHYVRVHGYRRAYRMAGSGPPLLLIHGIADSSVTWEPVFDELAEHYTVIAPDLLGHGESAKPRADYAVAAYACGMRDLLTVLGIDRVTLVGHSLGGGVALQFAYQFPDRCERLILVASAGMGRGVHPVFRAATMPGADPAISVLTSPPVRAAVHLLAPVLRRLGGMGLGEDLDYVLRLYGKLANPTARRAFLRTIRAAADPYGQAITMLDRGYLAASMPAMIMWGTEDAIIPYRHAETAHALFPGSQLEVFEGAGHFPHHADPDRFTKIVQAFLLDTEPAEYDREHWQALLRAGRLHAPEESSGS
ncbi:alpha/beta fold hydrolase [Nocardia stercoris]|uniref:Alpha/beta fold hydrolase n=1 Tax=Nocardia stercoris TaxID=2483361 RepID=A0A3M2L896_9NOCA|nr:alpha/beta fold hydrolase [Nocardia stercoris]RMI32145.1 alpha/beta fold hydrolase [Nocardia stercoris]